MSPGGGGVQFEHRVGEDLLNRVLVRSGHSALDDVYEMEVAIQNTDRIADLRLQATGSAGCLGDSVRGSSTQTGASKERSVVRALVEAMLDQIVTDPTAFKKSTTKRFSLKLSSLALGAIADDRLTVD